MKVLFNEIFKTVAEIFFSIVFWMIILALFFYLMPSCSHKKGKIKMPDKQYADGIYSANFDCYVGEEKHYGEDVDINYRFTKKYREKIRIKENRIIELNCVFGSQIDSTKIPYNDTATVYLGEGEMLLIEISDFKPDTFKLK